MPDDRAERPAPETGDNYVYVRRLEGFDIVFLGGGKKADHFPQHVAHAETNEWAERICAALEGA